MTRLLLAMVAILFLSSVAIADTIYLRDGRTINGTVLGFVNGRFAVRLAPRNRPSGYPSSRNEGEIVFFRAEQVERVEIEGRSFDELRFESRSVQVNLAPNWIDSGVDLRRNEKVEITASGTILAGRSRLTPDGLRTADPNAPLPRAAEGLLIGAIGPDAGAPIIELGQQSEFVADRDGRLYLTVNRGSYADARGSYTVQVRKERNLSWRRGDREADADDTYSDNRTDPAPTRTRNRPRYDTRPARGPMDGTFDVPGTSRGVDTGIDLVAGDQVTFAATGKVIAGRRIGEVTPEGGRATGFGAIVGTRPVPASGPGALIGYLRLPSGQLSPAFFIGSNLAYTATQDGRLYLAINDDDYSDNGGSFSVKVRY